VAAGAAAGSVVQGRAFDSSGAQFHSVSAHFGGCEFHFISQHFPYARFRISGMAYGETEYRQTSGLSLASSFIVSLTRFGVVIFLQRYSRVGSVKSESVHSSAGATGHDTRACSTQSPGGRWFYGIIAALQNGKIRLEQDKTSTDGAVDYGEHGMLGVYNKKRNRSQVTLLHKLGRAARLKTN
jgi:hypothetical protein